MAITGFKYPLELNEAGGLKTATDAEYVAGLIRSFVETELGERIGLESTYGTPDYLFGSYPSFGFVGEDLKRKLSQSIPQAEFGARSTIQDNGEGLIEIFWAFQGERQETLKFIVETGQAINVAT